MAGLGIVLATMLGFVIGIARLSPNWLVARLAGGYVELIRNLPLLFQILFWYLAVLGTLPGPRQSLSSGGADLSQQSRAHPARAGRRAREQAMSPAHWCLVLLAAIALVIWAQAPPGAHGARNSRSLWGGLLRS